MAITILRTRVRCVYYTQCNAASSNKVTIHAWIKATSDGDIRKASGNTSSPMNDDIAQYDFDINDGKLRWWARGANWRNQSFSGNTVVTDDEWHYVTLVAGYIGQFYAATLMYVDGALDAVGANAGPNYSWFANCTPDITTASNDVAHGFAGQMENLSVDYETSPAAEPAQYWLGNWETGEPNPVDGLYDPQANPGIPEPATVMLLLAGLGFLVRRKK